MPMFGHEDQVYNVKVYRGRYYQGSVVVTVDRRSYRSMSGSHTLSADLEALEVACRSAATYFGIEANNTTVSDLVQQRLDQLIVEEQRKQPRAGCDDDPFSMDDDFEEGFSTHDPET
jgi:hypothetical protein